LLPSYIAYNSTRLVASKPVQTQILLKHQSTVTLLHLCQQQFRTILVSLALHLQSFTISMA
jgi:hypothetical protein